MHKETVTPGCPDLRGQHGSCSAVCQPLRPATNSAPLNNEAHANSLSVHHPFKSEPDPEGDTLPYTQLDVPFDPNRTLNADAAMWRYYTEEQGGLQPQSFLDGCFYCLLVVCWRGHSVKRVQRRRRQCQRQQKGERHSAGRQDLEQQQQEEPWHGDKEVLTRHKKRRYRSFVGLPILSPRTRLVRIWDVVISLVDLTYTAYFVPLSLAFDDMEGSSFNWFTITNIVGTALYIADIVMAFHTGFICSYNVKRAVVMEGHKVAEYYVRHGSFYIDCLATLPIVPELVLNALETGTNAYKWIYALRLLRLTRIFALVKVWGESVFTNTISRWLLRYTTAHVLYLLSLLLALTIIINLLGCIWWFVAELEGLQYSWVAFTEFPVPLFEASDPARWVASCYYLVTSMTTQGYDDITAVTAAEQAVALGLMAFSVFYFGFIIAFVGEVLRGSSGKAPLGDLLREKLEDVEGWMKDRHLSSAVQSKVRQYYVQVWASHAGIKEAEYFGDLPFELRAEIVKEQAGDPLRHSQLFMLLDDKMREQLVSAALPVRMVAGHNLFEEGEPADSFYVLQEGVVVSLRGPHRLRRLHGPALIGQTAVFSHYVEECSRRLHTVRAVSNCTLWEFRSAHLAKMLNHSPAFLPPFCESYLQYLADSRRRLDARGQPIPQRIHRMEQQIGALRDKVTLKLKRRHSDSSAAATPLPSLPPAPFPSPSASSPDTGKQSSAGAAAGTGRARGGIIRAPHAIARSESSMRPVGTIPWQGLPQPSTAPVPNHGSEGVIDDEQLSSTELES